MILTPQSMCCRSEFILSSYVYNPLTGTWNRCLTTVGINCWVGNDPHTYILWIYSNSLTFTIIGVLVLNTANIKTPFQLLFNFAWVVSYQMNWFIYVKVFPVQATFCQSILRSKRLINKITTFSRKHSFDCIFNTMSCWPFCSVLNT